MDNNIDIPEFFVCPISLDLMKEPVTTLSGITYDRSNIHRWLSTSNKCPVTMQPLTGGPTILTPNHTLSRMLRSWCSANNVPIDDHHLRGPTPPTRAHVAGLIESLRGPEQEPKLAALRKLEALASESDRNRVLLGRADLLTSSLVSFVVKCHEARSTDGLREALSLFFLVIESLPRPIGPPPQTSSIIDALLWVLGAVDDCSKPYAAHFLKCVIERARPSAIDGLGPEFFETVLTNLIRAESLLDSSLLKVLLDACSSGRNREVMVGIGAVSGLVEAEVRGGGGGEREATELVLEILCYLCSSAEGRAQLVGHPSGISMVTKRILKVSPAADDSAVFVIWMVSRYSGTSGVLREMGRVGTVGKLCMLMQANCDKQIKEKAKDILRAHSDVWRGSIRRGLIDRFGV